MVFGRRREPPEWLQESWGIMGMDEAELQAEKREAMARGERMEASTKEFFERLSLFSERDSRILADHVVSSSQDLRALIMKMY